MTRNDTIAFLSCALPPEGFYCAVIFNSAKPRPGIDKPRQVFVTTIEELADVILAADAQGKTVYHACASYRDRGKRTQGNALMASSFWLDLDVATAHGRANTRKYPDKQSAAQSILDFCVRLALPRPLLVDSGTGVHAYWPLDRPLLPDEWYRYATGLKQTCVREGLKTDPARTADIASILRTPGTHNRKEGEQLVQAERTYDQHSITRFGAVAERHVPARLGTNNSRQRGTDNSILDRIEAGQSYGAVYADAIADQCAQLAQFRRSGNLAEPVWYAAIGVLSRCADGEVKAHEWSANDYPGYSHDAVVDRLARSRLLTGATTCAKFHDLEPSICDRCPLYGRINSPISIAPRADAGDHGVQSDQSPRGGLREIIVGQITENDEGESVLPPLPANFLWSTKAQLLFKQEGNNGEDTNVIVAEHPIYLKGVQIGELEGTAFSYRFTKFLPKEGWSDVIIDARTLHGAAGISEMFGKGAVIHEPKIFLNYARHAVDDYHKEAETQVRYDQYGWKNDDRSFLYGKSLYTAAGPVTAIGAKEVDIRNQWIGPRRGGSLDAWTEAADSLFATDMEAHSTMLLASFAAPLMRFQSRDEGGAILHLFTPESGMGKTMALRAGWTVWGVREGLSLTNDDTKVSKPIVMGTLANLPVIYDELRDKDPEYIQRMVIMFTEGRDRLRGMIDGTLRHTKANWQTILLSAANKSLIDQLQNDGTDAPSYRVLELTSDTTRTFDKAKGARLERMLTENAGHAGDAYLRYLMQPDVLAFVRAALEHWTKEIYSVTGVDAAFRFRVRAIGAIAVAAKIVLKLDILHFNVDRIIDWLIRDIGHSRHVGVITQTVPIDKAIGALGQFINEHYGETLIVADKFKPKAQRMQPILKPAHRLSIRYELATQRVFISTSVFRDWAIKKQMSPRIVIDMLLENKVIADATRNITLSAGTDIPGAQVQCIELNAQHPCMSGLVASVHELQHRGEQDVHHYT